ncbi:MAG TPA: DUF4349 domain-containing protein [Hymenobacter sp.]|uniref:DUF4349 domain-containing protein n=1 Tax=Hymenobacter sp. TaxID=1898978 RepID=UPI002D8053AB|nr:DUF4349 domain-containing protein [Hymenobacter sp.]HET9503100.1 DUF4349 domain-containing protein [Hymenobacter sp.]
MKRLILPALLGLALAGYDSSHEETSADAPTQTTVSEVKSPTLPPMPAAEPEAAPAAAIAMTAPVAKPNRDIIYQGELDLAVNDFNQATTRINQLLELHDAYLSTAHETRADGQHRQEMTIKVVPGKFVELVTALSQLGHVENKDVASADVTADVLQTAKTLATKQAAATKLQQQLAKTTDKDEASRLQAQASQLQTDLATDQAKLQQIGARSTWATLRLRYYQPLAATDTDEPQPAFAPQFQVAFNRGWSVVLSIAVVLTNIWPLLLLSGLGTWGWRWWRLRHPEQA